MGGSRFLGFWGPSSSPPRLDAARKTGKGETRGLQLRVAAMRQGLLKPTSPHLDGDPTRALPRVVRPADARGLREALLGKPVGALLPPPPRSHTPVRISRNPWPKVLSKAKQAARGRFH